YWTHQLEAISPLELPTDFPRPAIQSIRGATKQLQIDTSLSEQIMAFAQAQHITPFMLILSACKVLLYRYSNQQDICIGSPVAGRTTKAVEPLIGCFVNTLALRSQLDAGQTVQDLLQTVKQVTLDAFSNQLVPFEQIVEVLGIERDLSRSPIFQVSFTYQNTPPPQANFVGELEVDTGLEVDIPVTTQRDLSIFAMETPEGLQLMMNYCIDLFQTETIQQMLEHLHLLLKAMIEQPQTTLGQLPMMSKQERKLLLEEFNPTPFAYPQDQSITDLFEQQVTNHPDQIALVFGDRTWTYEQLNAQADRLAHYLQQRYEIESGDLVAMMLPRSEWAIIAILGILKAGAAYVPIDSKYPLERKQYILEDTQAKVLLIQSDALMEVIDFELKVCSVDLELLAFDAIESTFDEPKLLHPKTQLAYVMYTSGSTGVPKGVLIPHQAIARLIYNPDFAFLNEQSRLYQYAPLAFDASTFEIWGA
ncbi:MAG: condensation domain-containing protein, partial [Bacteroidota bacterium]